MLPGQNFRRGHQGRLPSALGGEPHAPRCHHGLAAAHISLAQPVHGPPGFHVRHRLRNGPALGLRKREGEGLVKFLHVRRLAGRPRHIRAPGAEHLQPAGEDEQLLKHHPPPGQVQRLRVRRKVDILIGVSAVAQLMFLPHRVRQAVGQQVAALGQPLAHGPVQKILTHPGGEGINGHNMPRKHLLPFLLHNGVDHPPGQQIPLHLAAENIGLAPVQAVFSVLLVKKGQVQGAAVIHSPGLHHRASAGNAAGHGVVCDHSPDAHRLPKLQLPDGPGHGPVLIPPG